MRGRVQVIWSCTNQTRANAARDFLIGQLGGRSFLTHEPPQAALSRGVWRVLADVSFDTQLERDQVQTICLTRQSQDTFILSGSRVTIHQCDHDDGANSCQSTFSQTVK